MYATRPTFTVASDVNLTSILITFAQLFICQLMLIATLVIALLRLGIISTRYIEKGVITVIELGTDALVVGVEGVIACINLGIYFLERLQDELHSGSPYEDVGFGSDQGEQPVNYFPE